MVATSRSNIFVSLAILVILLRFIFGLACGITVHKRCEYHVPHSCGLDHKKMSDALALIAKSGAKLPVKNSKTTVSDSIYYSQVSSGRVILKGNLSRRAKIERCSHRRNINLVFRRV